MYFKKMLGTRCYLSPMDPDDAAQYTAWLNDYAIARYLTLATGNLTVQRERDLILELSSRHNYAIVAVDSDALLGNCGLMDLDPLNGTAEIGIFIGDPRNHGRGYGREALFLLLDYSFSLLNLHNVMLRVYAHNTRAQATYRSLGFQEMGRRRQALHRDRLRRDEIYMDLLAEDFYAARDPRPVALSAP